MPVRRPSLGFALLFALSCRAPDERAPDPVAWDTHAQAPGIVPIAPPPPAIRATESAGVASAHVGEHAVVLVADTDDHAVVTLDATSLAQVARVELDGAPRDLLVLETGDVLVTLPEQNRIAVLASAGSRGELRIRRHVKTSTEPLSMAVSRNGTKVAVTAGAAHRVDVFATDTFALQASSDVAREPRAVMFAANDAVFVTHATQDEVTTLTGGAISLGIYNRSFDSRGEDPPRSARHANALVRVKGADGRETILVPLVQNAPQDAAPPGGYGGSGRRSMPKWGSFDDDFFGPERSPRRRPKPPEPKGAPNRMSAFDLRAIDAESAKHAARDRRDLVSTAVPPLLRECLLPRAAVALSDTRVVVACSGESQAIALDATAAFPRIVARWSTGRGPSAIARIADERAVVWSPLARTLATFASSGSDAGGAEPPRAPLAKVELPRARDIDAKILAGRELFMRNDDPRIAKDGVACATCHPDGRDDGIVWETPKGKRRPRTLAGNVARDTAFGWGAEHESIDSHVKETMKRLRGTGLPSEDLERVFAYLGSLPPVPLADVPRDAAALRGAELFGSERAACATCHLPENNFTDNEVHELGYGERVVTPSLHGVGRRAKLYHDGRYESFDALLTQPLDDWFVSMGGASRLTGEERSDLAAYLRTL